MASVSANSSVVRSGKESKAQEKDNAGPRSTKSNKASSTRKSEDGKMEKSGSKEVSLVNSQRTQRSQTKSVRDGAQSKRKSAKSKKERSEPSMSVCADPPQFPKEPLKLSRFIKKHLILGDDKFDYDYRDIFELLDRAMELFRKCPALIDIPAPVNVCGDVHGQYRDLMWIFTACGMPFKNRYLFLGDYVDRGPRSLEVIVLLLSLKVQFPKSIFLLRGNHELKNINKVYGFFRELQSRFNCYLKLYEKFNEVFAEMPLAATIRGKILCMHGGLSPNLNSLEDIRKLKKPIYSVKETPLAQDLLWSDPETGVQGFKPNKVRAVSHVFGEDAVELKLKQLDIGMVIRAHQAVEFGYAFFARRKLITIFSASEYNSELCNFAAVAQIDKELQVSFTQFKPAGYDAHRRKMERKRQLTQDNEDQNADNLDNTQQEENEDSSNLDDKTQEGDEE